MDMVIKHFSELTVDELYEILTLRSDIFIIEQTCVYPDCDGNDDKAYHLFVRCDNKITGCLRILRKNVTFDTEAIGRVAVHMDYRHMGIAKAMMGQAIEFARNMGAKTIKLAAQEYLKDFYGTLGFEPISEPYVEDGISHVNMELKG
jgi:ElaA protein